MDSNEQPTAHQLCGAALWSVTIRRACTWHRASNEATTSLHSLHWDLDTNISCKWTLCLKTINAVTSIIWLNAKSFCINDLDEQFLYRGCNAINWQDIFSKSNSESDLVQALTGRFLVPTSSGLRHGCLHVCSASFIWVLAVLQFTVRAILADKRCYPSIHPVLSALMRRQR